MSDIISILNKKYGADIIKAGSRATPMNRENMLHSGITSLDIATGVGGLVPGRIYEVAGPPHAGKSLALFSFIGSIQRNGGKAALIDLEGVFDPRFAAMAGIIPEELHLVDSSDKVLYGEDFCNITKMLIESGEYAVVGFDSTGSCTPKPAKDHDIGDSTQKARRATILTELIEDLVPISQSNGTVTIFISQLRSKPDFGKFKSKTISSRWIWGGNVTTTAPNCLNYLATCQIAVEVVADHKKEYKIGSRKLHRVCGRRVRYWVIKNKAAPPGGVAEFDIWFDQGVDREGDLLDVCVSLNIIGQKSSYFEIGIGDNIRKFNGRQAAIDFIKEEPELFEVLRKRALNVALDSDAKEASEDKDKEQIDEE